MKKNINFRFFSAIDAKRVLTSVSTIIIISAVIFSGFSFISENISPELINMTISLGTKENYTPSSNIAQTLLTITIPSADFAATQEFLYELPSENTALQPPPVVTPLKYVEYENEAVKTTDGIQVNNQSKKSFDTNSLLNKTLDLSLSGEPSVLIVHTHTTESYTPSPSYNYTPTETDRTLDSRFNMVAVGEVIYEKLSQKGINVIHDKTVNDYPSYSQSYSKSLKLVKSYVEKYPSIKFVIDVHRDAVSSGKVGTVTDFDKKSAQVMLVIGTNSSGLDHPNWQNNLSFALKLQHSMNKSFPSLARPINLRKERFNQHLAPYAFILEVGTNGNTLDEAKIAADYFSQAFLSLFKL